MANVFDYLKWRGDLSFRQSPFNDVDNLVLSLLAYIPFDGAVPASPGEGVPLREAALGFLSRRDAGKAVRIRRDLEFLLAVMDCPRFGSLRLSAYVSQLDPLEEKQFAAFAIDLGRGRHYMAFRGTDNTLVGWKEDFNMSFLSPVPSQEEALRYLEAVGPKLGGSLLLGGHSKGGNLAVYAAAFCSPELQKRIRRIYNNDGPGFTGKVLHSSGHRAVERRICTFVPQTSVIGMLLEHEERYTVVHSHQLGLLQHDPYSWEVLGAKLVFLEETSPECRFLDRTIKDWIAGMDVGERRQFVDLLFDVLGAGHAETLPQLTANWYKSARAMLKTLWNTDETTKRMLSRTLRLLWQSAKANAKELKTEKAPSL